MKIACISLGCPKNQVDLDVMVHILQMCIRDRILELLLGLAGEACDQSGAQGDARCV